MASLAAILLAVDKPNLRAFLRVIREGESNQIDDGPQSAYTLINGGGHFTDFGAHPYAHLPTTRGGKAAGAYQFLPTTWDNVAELCKLYDFSPRNQDIGACALVAGRDALDDVLAGDLEAAIRKCRNEWTSLPGASENSGRYTLARARAVFTQYGGTLKGVPSVAPTPQPAPEVQPPAPGGKMPILALISAFGPLITSLIPQLGKLLGSGSEVATRNQAAIQTVFDTIVTASNSTNVQDAVEKMQGDPALTAQVTQAVVTHPDIIGLLEVGGGIEKARAAGLAMQTAEKPFWYNPMFWVSMAFFPMMYMIVAAVLFTSSGDNLKLPEGVTAPYWALVGFDSQTRAGLINLIAGMVFGGIIGVWFGTSYGSQRKTEIAASGGGTTTTVEDKR